MEMRWCCEVEQILEATIVFERYALRTEEVQLPRAYSANSGSLGRLTAFWCLLSGFKTEGACSWYSICEFGVRETITFQEAFTRYEFGTGDERSIYTTIYSDTKK